MAESRWSLNEAKNKFSEVVEAARRGKSQIVTKLGVPVVAVIAIEDYDRLHLLEKMSAPSFADHLLDMPQDGGRFERL